MKDFFDKAEYVQADIENLLTIGAEESINLDFKAADSLMNTDGKKSEIAKDVSSFANSDGGIIIYGITETDHPGDSMSFIDGNTFSKEWLEQIINSRIQRRIPDLIIYPVRFDNDISRTVYVVKIPRSTLAPHMTSDKRYYKRFNFQSVQMEEYEVRDLFGRKQKTELDIADILFEQRSSGSSARQLRYAEYLLRYQIRNIGNTIEERFKLEIYIPKHLTQADEQTNFYNYKIREDGGISVYSVPNSSPIYQEETTTVITSMVQIRRDRLHLLETQGIRLKLFYSNGTKERTFNILDVLTYKGKPLRNEQWTDY